MDDGLRQLATIKSRIQAANYTMAAAVTVFIYDILLTLSDEIELVWKRDLTSVAALLYISNRYVSLAGIMYMAYLLSPYRPALSKSSCQSPVEYLLYSVGAASWAGLMTLRVGVLWKSTPFVVWFIWISCVGYAAFIFAASFIVYHALHDTLEYSYLLGVCISTSTASDSRFRSIGPAIQVAFVVALTALTAFKAYRYHAPIRFFQISSLFELLLRDGMLYLLVVMGLSVGTNLSWILMKDASARLYFFVHFNWAIFSLLVSRFFLRLRKLYHEQRELSAIGTHNVTYLFSARSSRISQDIHRTFSQPYQSRAIEAPFGENVRIVSPQAAVDIPLHTMSDPIEIEATAHTRPVTPIHSD